MQRRSAERLFRVHKKKSRRDYTCAICLIFMRATLNLAAAFALTWQFPLAQSGGCIARQTL